MSSFYILWGVSGLTIIAGALLIQAGIRKEDYKTRIRFIHYTPIKNYGKGFKIYLGIVLILLGLIVFFKPAV